MGMVNTLLWKYDIMFILQRVVIYLFIFYLNCLPLSLANATAKG